MATHDKSVPHSDSCTPDTCMRERARYWRDGGGAPLKFTYGRERFSGPTIRERQEHAIASAAAEGRSIRVKTHYDKGGAR